MFINYSAKDIFTIFEKRYLNEIYSRYPHIQHIIIKCYTQEQYAELGEKEFINSIEHDAFAYSISRNKDNSVSASIIYSSTLCEQIGLSDVEQFACIAHEVGHIIHYFNENLNGANELVIEMKADSIATELGLSSHLKSVLQKLRDSGMYSHLQCRIMTMRSHFLNC